MKEIGDILRQRREEQGLSLDEAQGKTKIRTKWLEALESGDESLFPAEVYLKGFLRSYAEALGLDGIALARRWDEIRSTPGGEKGEDEEGKDARERPVASWAKPQTRGLAELFSRPGRSRRRIPVLLIIGLVVLAGIWWLWQEGADPASLDPVEDPAGDVGQSPAEDPVDDDDDDPGIVDEDPGPQVVVERVGNGELFVVHGAESVVVTARARERCWLSVTADGERVYRRTMEIDEDEVTWTAGSEIVISAGNPPGLVLTINGVEIEPLDELVGVVDIRVQANP